MTDIFDERAVFMAMKLLESGYSLKDSSQSDGSGVDMISFSVSKVASYCGGMKVINVIRTFPRRTSLFT
jgi:hypothetical protein